MFTMPQIKVMTLVTENIAAELGSESGEDQEEL